MSDANKCDRCGEYFEANQSRRRYQFREDVLRNSMTPSIQHKPRDLCSNCYKELKEWWEQ